MKIKILILLISLIFLACSSDDSNEEPCVFRSVTLVDKENDCECYSYTCITSISVHEDEYYRLLNIKQNTNSTCPYVTVKEVNTGDVFNGYLQSMKTTYCSDI